MEGLQSKEDGGELTNSQMWKKGIQVMGYNRDVFAPVKELQRNISQ